MTKKQTSRVKMVLAIVASVVGLLADFDAGMLADKYLSKAPKCAVLRVMGIAGQTSLVWEDDTKTEDAVWLVIHGPLKTECKATDEDAPALPKGHPALPGPSSLRVGKAN